MTSEARPEDQLLSSTLEDEDTIKPIDVRDYLRTEIRDRLGDCPTHMETMIDERIMWCKAHGDADPRDFYFVEESELINYRMTRVLKWVPKHRRRI